MIAINLLQEELLMMGQPCSDADLIIQHSNKMPNSENFRALKMEFIDCDVSQFSTSRPSLTHTQPNPNHLRVRKTWDEYCHRIQRFNASDPMNQPKSALSAKQDTEVTVPSGAALAATSESMEAMMRRLLAEASTKNVDLKRPITQSEREAYKRGRQDARPDRPLYQERQPYLPPTYSRDQSRFNKPNQGLRPNLGQAQGQGQGQSRAQVKGRQNDQPSQGSNFRKYGNQVTSRHRTQERKVLGAAEAHDSEDHEQSQDYGGDLHAFSASRFDGEDDRDDEERDRYAMMGRQDYHFNGSEDEEDGPA
jgi:hypothetical protein